MRNTQRSGAKVTGALLFVCLASGVAIRFGARKVEAAPSPPPATVAQATPTPTVRGRHNGKLVFTSDRHNEALNIWTMNPDGSSPTRLTHPTPRGEKLPIFTRVYDDFPAWSPDGTQIAFISNRDCGADARNLDCERTIYIMNADGSNVRRILVDGIQEGLPEIGSLAWSPDGTKFAFDAGVHFTVGLVRPSTNIYVVNADGSNTVKLTHDSEVYNGRPTWSPDGKQIAYESNRDGRPKIWAMNADGNNQRKLTDVHDVSDIRFYTDYMPSWSPDGTKIVFKGERDDNGMRNCEFVNCSQIYVINADGSNEKRLTENFNLLQGDTFPRWSPDGTKIVVTRSLTTLEDNKKEFDRGRAIVVMNADGSNQINLSNRSDLGFTDGLADWQPLPAPANPPPPAVLGFSAASYSAFEDSGSIPITVTRAGNTSEAVSCFFATEDGAATVQRNYAPVFRALRFAPGETEKIIPVPLTDNGHAWGNRFFKITLFDNEGNATFVGGQREAIVTVMDRDAAPRARNPMDEARAFVRQHYVDFLNREPDTDGFAFWTNEIESCGANAQCREVKRVNVSAAFFLSIEFQETGYFFLRFRVLNPHNSTGGFDGFMRGVQALNRGVIVGQAGWEEQLEANKRALLQQYFDDDRVVPSFGFTNEQYVDLLFQYAGVTPTQAERAALVNGLNAGTQTRPTVFRKVLDDERFKRRFFNPAFVLMQYYGYLRRDPDETGYNFWLRKLDQFRGNYVEAEMVKAFLSSSEHRARFGP